MSKLVVSSATLDGGDVVRVAPPVPPSRILPGTPSLVLPDVASQRPADSDASRRGTRSCLNAAFIAARAVRARATTFHVRGETRNDAGARPCATTRLSASAGGGSGRARGGAYPEPARRTAPPEWVVPRWAVPKWVVSTWLVPTWVLGGRDGYRASRPARGGVDGGERSTGRGRGRDSRREGGTGCRRRAGCRRTRGDAAGIKALHPGLDGGGAGVRVVGSEEGATHCSRPTSRRGRGVARRRRNRRRRTRGTRRSSRRRRGRRRSPGRRRGERGAAGPRPRTERRARRGRGPSPRANRARGRGGGRARDGVDARPRGVGRMRTLRAGLAGVRASRATRGTRVSAAGARAPRPVDTKKPLRDAAPPLELSRPASSEASNRRRGALETAATPARRATSPAVEHRGRTNQPEFETSKERAPESGSVGEIFFTFEDWLAGDL